MKLIAMKFGGFGPYKGEYAIDFAALTRSRMFLIDGETGAGKTTILDCVTFALYGNVSGNEKSILDAGGDGQRVRSRFLMGERTETYVDLIFRSGDDYYEVRRTPKYDRPKDRGEGFTSHNATGKLMRIDRGIAALVEAPGNDPERYFAYAGEAGHSEAITSRAGDVRPEITRIIGLDREQFSRTIMLAQGQFAMFLSLAPEKRTELIENLFGASIYETIQNELVERRKTMKTGMVQEGIRLAGGIATARTTATRILEQRGLVEEGNDGPEHGLEILSNARWGLDREDADKLAYPAREPDEILRSLHETVAGIDVECRKLLGDGETENRRAARELDHARSTQADAEALRAAATKELRDIRALRDVQADGPAIERSRHDLALAVEAQPILDLDKTVTTAHEEQLRQERQAEALQEQLERLPDAGGLERQREQALQKAAGAEAAHGRLEQADAHERLIDAAEQAKAQHERALLTVEQARERDDQAQRALADLPKAEDIEHRLQEITERLGGEQGLTQKLDHVRRMRGHAEQAETLAATLPGLEQRCKDAEAAQQRAERSLARVENDIRRSGVVQYAIGLEDGEPCPVCGSLDHPSPAVAPDSVADAQELDDMKQHVAELRDAAEQARADMRAIRQQIDTHREQSEGAGIEQTDARIRVITASIRALDEARQQRDELRDTQQRITAATAKAQQAHTTLAAAEAKAEETGNTATAAAKRAEGHTKATVAAERAAARHQLDTAEQAEHEAARLKRLIDQRAELERRHTQAQAQADAAARTTMEATAKRDRAIEESAHFATMGEAAAAGLDEREQDAIRQRIRRHEDVLHTATANLTRSRNELKEVLTGIGGDDARELGIAEAGPDTVDPHTEGAAGEPSTPTAYTETGEPTPLGEAIAAIDTGALAAATQEAERRAAETDRRIGALTALAQDWHTQAKRMERTAGTWAEQATRFAPLERMAALAAGDNKASGASNGLTLTTYAVTERFRDVLDRANELLNDIQGGVYELRLVTEAAANGNRKTGLGITVFDRRTEQERNPGTLSGGETFFVSLALALALADIIQAENGGISMDTLFVDEGFGTLSQDYLADVMDMLRRISRTRDVGIISHVDWLKDQIAERISVSRVTPDRESRLEVIA
ncbi:AAA family ATPase [Bifidobacterium stellenboschense]|uniref:Nuclease SbcCD subunit C n=1 Tax=Bifidobacterium stellenboschense TaxID=762211 RepID=A0A087DU78_9BIFI|nr:AAA family ATPase [Bifidobacterium stellenboschense]KFI99078.1 exonuclease SbcC [Bifidobacterium stellenboschense]